MSDDTLDGILAAVLLAAMAGLLIVIGLWSAEAHADRVATATATTATATATAER